MLEFGVKGFGLLKLIHLTQHYRILLGIHLQRSGCFKIRLIPSRTSKPNTRTLPEAPLGGIEWLVEAYECDPVRLSDSSILKDLFQFLVADLDLRPVGEAIWHQFPHTGGLTGLLLLQESHLAIHTFPEYQSVCLNLFCCRRRSVPNWEGLLAEWMGARRIHVEECERNYVCDELPVLRR